MALRRGTALIRDGVAMITDKRLSLVAATAIVASLFVAPATAGQHSPARSASTSATCPWIGSSAGPDARADQVLAAMSSAQKFGMLHQYLSDLTYFGNAGFIPGIPSLCVPSLVLDDAGSGLGDGQLNPTAFPAAISLASSWDPSLSRQVGTTLGSEAFARGVNVLLAPDVNIARVPMNGRNSEAFGEDPYLSGQTAAPYIQGVQSQHVVATVKHYAANNQETNRSTINELIAERTFQEIYLPQFEAAVRQGQAGAVMCSYNRVNGPYACESPHLLTDVLRKELGFPGFVMSDWGAQHSTVQSVLAGLDMEMDLLQVPDAITSTIPSNPGVENYYGGPLQAAVSAHRVPITAVDQMVHRILRSMFAVGLFDHVAPGYPLAYLSAVDTAANRAVALKAAEAGTVLLKNTGNVLPLAGNQQRIAVIGQDAGTLGATTVAQAGGSVHVNQLNIVSPAQAIAARAAANGDRVVYADGMDIGAAVQAAKSADVAIVYGGYSEAEGTDQKNLGFSQTLVCSLACIPSPISNTDQLISAVAAANPNTIVVLNTGGPVLMPWLPKVKGVVEAWYPGEEDGTAAAAVLFGDVNPSGKLPETFPASIDQIPTMTKQQWPGVNGIATYSEGLLVGYRWYDARNLSPLFPFGYGLSYTNFAFSDLAVAPSGAGGTVSFTVTNAGKRSGAEVAQVYVTSPSSTGEPPKQLKNYRKVFLNPGQSSRVTLTLDQRAFSYWGPAGWQVAPGCYTIAVGDSSRSLPLRAPIAMAGGSCP